MYILKDEQQIQNAIKKAMKLKPKIKVLSFGKYLVTGSKGNLYTVTCRKDERTNKKIVDCSCKAGEHRMPCYHSAAAIAQHIYLATIKRNKKAQESTSFLSPETSASN